MGIKIFLEPLDTLFFRDSKPFAAGEDTFAESMFPTPLTIFGAIGSYILEKNNTDLIGFFKSKVEDQTLGKYDAGLNSTRLKLKGPFIFKNKMYLPPPANLFLFDGYEYRKLFPDRNANPKWDIENNSLKPLRLMEDREYKSVKGYIPIDEIEKYLKNENITWISNIEEQKFFVSDRRFGHKMNRDTLTVEEGYLYSAEHLQFAEVLNSRVYEKTELLVFIKGLVSFNFSDDILLLGGERKRARIKVDTVDNISLRNDGILATIKQNKRFFIYFITPVVFNNGYNRKSWPLEFNNAELVGLAVNKPLYLSGWQRTSIAQGFPRPTIRAVPAGSVYFFDAPGWKDGQFDALYDRYNFNDSLSEQYPCAGFGIALIGVW